MGRRRPGEGWRSGRSSGVVTLVGGLIGDVLGGVTSASGVGAPVGVPAMVLSTGLVVGGAGNIAAGIRGLLTTGSGSGAGGAGGERGELSKEAQKGIRSLEKQIAQHEKKLADFKANPTVRPGMENLPKEVIEQQQKARIRHLETEIQTFKDNIDKLKNGGQ